jgi:ketosteroid isomerase-like protein
MKTIRVALLSCCFIILGWAACQGADDKLRAILEGRYAAMKSAMANRDANEIAAVLAPDFVSVDVSGNKRTHEEMIESVKALPVDPNKVSNTTLLSIETSGDKAVVKQRYDMKTVKMAADGSKHDFALTTLSTDLWILTTGTWLLQRTATDQVDSVVDGRSIIHKVREVEP